MIIAWVRVSSKAVIMLLVWVRVSGGETQRLKVSLHPDAPHGSPPSH